MPGEWIRTESVLTKSSHLGTVSCQDGGWVTKDTPWPKGQHLWARVRLEKSRIWGWAVMVGGHLIASGSSLTERHSKKCVMEHVREQVYQMQCSIKE